MGHYQINTMPTSQANAGEALFRNQMNILIKIETDVILFSHQGLG